MSRAIVLGSVLPDPGDERVRREVYRSIEACSLFRDAGNPARIDPLRELVHRAYPNKPPRVLDCFAGGGAIPLEALRLGCETTAIDLNPVAHLIELCMLEYPQLFGDPDERGRNSLAEDVRRWGHWVGERAREAVQALYPSFEGTRPLVWFWARTMPCQNPQCGFELPLVTSWWLAKRRRGVWLAPVIGESGIELSLHCDGDGPTARPVMRASSSTCPACGTTATARAVRAWAKEYRFGVRLLAVLEERDGERRYRLPEPHDLEGPHAAADFGEELPELPDGTTAIPDEFLDVAQASKYGMLPYGVTTFAELFTARQLRVLAALCQAVRDAHTSMLSEGIPADRARAITTYLGLLVDRVTDYNAAFSTWHVTGSKVNPVHLRQSLQMVWDFIEIDPFSDVSGNWTTGVSSAASAIERCRDVGSQPAHVLRGNAQSLDMIPDGFFDAVVVDPPYYDAVQYADLSDFFYIWLRRSIGELYPDLFAAPFTPKAQEVIENRADRKSPAYISSEEFERRLVLSIAEMRRVVRPDGVVTIVFAHTDSDAWERLLRALLSAGLVVSASWPMLSEMGSRATARISAVLGSSVVLVCRPRVAAEDAFYDDVLRELDQRIGERMDEFEQLGLHGADYLISAIGPAFEVFGKYSRVQRLNGEDVAVADLLALARRTVARHAMRRVLGSEALSAVDDVSLFYLTWRWAYGSAKVPVDDAQKLGKAFHVEVAELDGVDGLVATARDSYALRGPDERKRIKLGTTPMLIDVLHVACTLFEKGRRGDLAAVLASSGMADEAAFWAAARAIAESLPDGNRERTMLVNLLGGREQVVAAAREAQPSEALRLFDEAGR